MERFAFIIHPITARDVARRYPIAKLFPDRLIEAVIKHKDPIVAAKVTAVTAHKRRLVILMDRSSFMTEGISGGYPP